MLGIEMVSEFNQVKFIKCAYELKTWHLCFQRQIHERLVPKSLVSLYLMPPKEEFLWAST